MIGGVYVSLVGGEYRVEHFGRAPHLAVYYRLPTNGGDRFAGNVQYGWMPECVWQGGQVCGPDAEV